MPYGIKGSGWTYVCHGYTYNRNWTKYSICTSCLKLAGSKPSMYCENERHQIMYNMKRTKYLQLSELIRYNRIVDC